MVDKIITDTKAVGALIKERRMALGITQPELALASGVGIRFVVDAESGKETCRIGLVLRLLAGLGITLRASTQDDAPPPPHSDRMPP